jgi:DNA-binding PadR family transcriptional regulator
MLIINLGKIVRFVGWGLNKAGGILIQPAPIYVFLVFFVLILIVFLLIKLRKTKLSEKEMFILGIIDERELGLNLLFKVYKQRFEEDPRTKSNCVVTIKQLEKKKLIRCEAFTGGINGIHDELFQLTKKGRKRFEKLDSVIKEKAEGVYNKLLAMPKMKFGRKKLERIEPNKEIIFILELLAKQQKRSMRNTALRNYYFKNFSNKKVIDFNIVWNRLQTGDLITEYRGSPGYGRSYIYSITDRGVEYLRTYKENKF